MVTKRNQTRRGKDTGDHGTYLRRHFMERPAWRAISPKAQMLYIWVRLRMERPEVNNNGRSG